MKLFFTVIMSLLFLITTAEAAKIDAYRDIISSGRFTLKYTIVGPPVRVTNKEATLKGSGFFDNFEMTDTSALQFQHSNNFQNIIVHDGANSYMENPVSITVKVLHNSGLLLGVKSKSIQNPIGCVLKKNGENFRFTYSQKGDKKTYYGNYGSKGVYANLEELNGQMSYLDVLKEDYSYGTLTTALSPLISPDKIIATPYTPEYKFIGSGNLDDGLSYEDFFGSKNGFNCAIRYYFDGDTLTKIAVFDYVADGSRIQSYEKYLVQIDEFSATLDQSYLTLPSQLKDTTKRDKEVSK